MPELPPPPDADPSWYASLLSWVRRQRPAVLLGTLGAVVAAVVVAVVAWAAFLAPGAGGGPPVELTLPRAGTPGMVPDVGGDRGGRPEHASGATSAVVVHVAGAVAAPGLYRLGGDARVADALDAAGGPAGDADLDVLNLAARVADGERIYVARRGEVAPTEAPAGGVGGGGGEALAGPLDLNVATAQQLEELPGVGPSTAAAIVAYRAEKGRFRSVDELLEVRGIGAAKLASIRSKVRVR